MRVLVADIGGTSVKVLVSGKRTSRQFPCGATMTPQQMGSSVRKISGDWKYDVISIGYPGPVLRGAPAREPSHLAPGWVHFNFEERSINMANRVERATKPGTEERRAWNALETRHRKVREFHLSE